jgi:hypothetical protein
LVRRAARWNLLLPRRRGHQTQNGLVHLIELAPGVRIEYSDGMLQRLQFLSQLRMCRDGLTQPREGAHDVDAHLHSARAVQNRRSHDGAVLGKGQR